MCLGCDNEGATSAENERKRNIGTTICLALIPLTPFLITIWGLVSARTQIERLDALASQSSEQEVLAYSSSALEQGGDKEKMMLCLDELTLKNLGKSEVESDVVDEWRAKFFAITVLNTAQLILTVLLYVSAILCALLTKKDAEERRQAEIEMKN